MKQAIKPTHKRHNSVLVLMLAILMLWVMSVASQAADPQLVKGGIGGWLNVEKPLTAADFKGRLVLLDFWTYGCINCMQVIPDLEVLEEKFGENLLIIGVHSAKFSGEQASERILAAAQRFGLKHPVANDADYAIWKAYGVRAWPTLVLLDEDGKEISRYEGEGHGDALSADIANALGKSVSNGVKSAQPLPVIAKTEKDKSLLWFPARLIRGTGVSVQSLYFITDTGHNQIVAFDRSGKIQHRIGSGKAELKDGAFQTAGFNQPRGLANLGDKLYVADTGNHAIREIDFKTGMVKTLAGTGQRGYDRSVKNEPAVKTQLASPWDIAFIPDARQTRLAIAMAGLHQIWVYDVLDETISVLAGTGREDIKDGAVSEADLAQPSGLEINSAAEIFFVDAESSALRRLNQQDVKTFIGTGLFDFGFKDGTYPQAQLQHPQGLAVKNQHIYVADTYNNAIRKYDIESGELSTLSLGKTTLNEPSDMLIEDNTLWIVDAGHHAVRQFDLVTGKLTDFPLSQ